MQKYSSKTKKRKPSSQRNQQLHPSLGERRSIKNNEVILVCVIIIALLGTGISFFVTGAVVIWLLAGALIGAGLGYLFGVQIVKGLSKK